MAFIEIKENSEVSPTEKLRKYTDEKFKEIYMILLTAVIVLLVMVAGLVFAYWEFTYKESRIIEEKFLENKFKILELEKNSEILKLCLKSGGWNKCF